MRAIKTVMCSYCNGTGRIELTGVHADTLRSLRAAGDEIYGAEFARREGCNATAMNNRLVYLHKHGFAVARRYGRKTYYRAVDEHEPQGTDTEE